MFPAQPNDTVLNHCQIASVSMPTSSDQLDENSGADQRVYPRNKEMDQLDNDGKQHCDDDDDDESEDFGDFETAPHFEEADQEISRRTSDDEEPLPCTSSFATQMQPSFHNKSINQLLEEAWRLPEKECDNFLRPLCDTKTQDLFLLMDGDGNGVDGLDEKALKGYQLWSQICCLEEMRALQFRWELSRTYELFVQSVLMNEKSVPLTSCNKAEMQKTPKSVEQLSGSSSADKQQTPDPVANTLL